MMSCAAAESADMRGSANGASELLYETEYDIKKRHPGSSLWVSFLDVQEILK